MHTLKIGYLSCVHFNLSCLKRFFKILVFANKQKTVHKSKLYLSNQLHIFVEICIYLLLSEKTIERSNNCQALCFLNTLHILK